jgi:hypothetical protein
MAAPPPTACRTTQAALNKLPVVGTAIGLLKPGGRAFLQYDAGHFRSQDLKERLLVPVGRVLARLGSTRHYLRAVDDHALFRIVERCGGRVVTVRKFNLDILKRRLRDDVLTDEVARLWHDFERRMNDLVSPDLLDAIFWGTVVVLERPEHGAAGAA